MNADGLTRRMSLSVSFLWIMFSLSLLVLGALAYLIWAFCGLYLDNGSTRVELDFTRKRMQAIEFNRSQANAPEEAKRLLDRLDMAVMAADGADDLILPSDLASSVSPASPQSEGQVEGSDGDQALDPSSQAEGRASTDPGGGSSGPDSSAFGLSGSGQTGGNMDTEAEAWASLDLLLPPIASPASLDVDDFKFGPEGQFSFFLKQAGGPGQRARGRAVTVLALASPEGQVALSIFPEADLAQNGQAWEVGSKYNIIAAKVIKGQVAIPEGGRVLGAEVLAFDEDSKALVFRKKIKNGGD
jgi:hypothetical protein